MFKTLFLLCNYYLWERPYFLDFERTPPHVHYWIKWNCDKFVFETDGVKGPWTTKQKGTSSFIPMQKFLLGQSSKGWKSENYNHLVSIFIIREYLFWFLYLQPFYAYDARLAQSVEHETLNLRVVGLSPTLGAAYFCDLFRSILCLWHCPAFNSFLESNLVWRLTFSSEHFLAQKSKLKSISYYFRENVSRQKYLWKSYVS